MAVDYEASYCTFWAALDRMWKGGPVRKAMDDAGGCLAHWCRSREQDDPLGAYARSIAGLRPHFEVLSRAQIDAYREAFGEDPRWFAPAIEDFAEQAITDPRTGTTPAMSGDLAWFIWYVYMRGCIAHGIDEAFWTSAVRSLMVAFDLSRDAIPGTRRPEHEKEPIRQRWAGASDIRLDDRMYTLFGDQCPQFVRPASLKPFAKEIQDMADIDELRKELEAVKKELRNTRRVLSQKPRFVAVGFFAQAMGEEDLADNKSAGLPMAWNYWDDTGGGGYIFPLAQKRDEALLKSTGPMGARAFDTEAEARQWLSSPDNDFVKRARCVVLLAVTDYNDPLKNHRVQLFPATEGMATR